MNKVTKKLKALHNDLKVDPSLQEQTSAPEKHELEVDFYQPIEGLTPVPSKGRPGANYYPVWFDIQVMDDQVTGYRASSGEDDVTHMFTREHVQSMYDHYLVTGKNPTYQNMDSLNQGQTV